MTKAPDPPSLSFGAGFALLAAGFVMILVGAGAENSAHHDPKAWVPGCVFVSLGAALIFLTIGWVCGREDS